MASSFTLATPARIHGAGRFASTVQLRKAAAKAHGACLRPKASDRCLVVCEVKGVSTSAAGNMQNVGAGGAGIDNRNDGGFGARDARTDELESNFAEKTVGQADTEHVVQIPESAKAFLGMANRVMSPEKGAKVVEEAQAMVWLKQLDNDWTIENKNRLELSLNVKSEDAGNTLKALMAANLEGTGESVDASVTSTTLTVKVEGLPEGLTENQFIIAAKAESVDNLADLLAPKKKAKQKFWA